MIPLLRFCAEKKPQCQRCCDSGRACSYGVKLTWPDEALLRGIVIGRAGTRGKKGGQKGYGSDTASPQNATPPTQLQMVRHSRQPWIAFLNTTCDDVFVHSNQEVTGSSLLNSKEEDADSECGKSAPRTPTLD